MQTDMLFDKRVHHHHGAPDERPEGCAEQTAGPEMRPAERRTRWALGLTAVAMVAEIVGGWWSNSMAVLADGWHMGSHALALGLSVAAYSLARRWARSSRFAFGTWKIEILGGYTSAIVLLGIALLMLVQSVQKLLTPEPVLYGQALGVAVAGLAVNLLCALLLSGGGHDHHHHHSGHHHGDHSHDHSHDHSGQHSRSRSQSGNDRHHDLNLRSAYIHVMTDAMTSVLAIVALIGGAVWGLGWLDPVMGIVGAVLVALWARGLLREASQVLLDRTQSNLLVENLKTVVGEVDGVQSIDDLHVWQIGAGTYACAVSVRALWQEGVVAAVHRRVTTVPEVSHLTVEVWPVVSNILTPVRDRDSLSG